MFQIINGKEYIQIEALGSNTLTDFITSIIELFGMPDYKHRNDIWILGDKFLDLTFEQLGTITDFIAANYPSGATRTKAALVAAPGLNRSFAELWVGTAGDLPFATGVFSTLDQAVDWVTT